ncbi:sensor histidine kinase [Actinocorallia populi]|uniref:sensor histidine kinase n=1 Tax=Actinocorallia populi TaxID=2079200 RepID=UPI000D088979|nr:histidine kinase [Actinocorallia populi]
MAPRLVVLAIFTVIGVNGALTLTHVATDRDSLGRMAVAVLASCVLLAAQLGHFGRIDARPAGVTAHMMLWGQALLAYLPFLYVGYPWLGMQAFTAGNALLVLRGPWRWLAFSAVVASVGAMGAHYGEPPIGYLYLAVLTMQYGLVFYGLVRLRSEIQMLRRMRTDLARLSVAEERLRFGRDLHDLLASGLSALTLTCEVALRLVGADPGRARAEIFQALEISRRSLSDVRSVVLGDTRLLLREEIEAARSLLAAAGVRFTVARGEGPLPEPVEAVFATVLREGVTNVLRHASATGCDVVLERSGATATIKIANDGARTRTHVPLESGGSGLANLSRRVRDLGGTLTAESGDDGAYLLAASVPVKAERGRRVRPPRERRPHSAVPVRHPRPLVASILACEFVRSAMWVFGTVDGTVATVLGLACVLVGAALVMWHLLASPPGVGTARTRWVLAAFVGVATAQVALLQNVDFGLLGILAGCVLLAFRPPVAIPCVLAVVLCSSALRAAFGGTAVQVIWSVFSPLATGVVVFALASLIGLADRAHAARRELADLAVTEQRLRFERDLQDLVGCRLSTIIMRATEADWKIEEDPEEAREELKRLLSVARQALNDVREVAAGYREVDLETESSKARRILMTTGIHANLVLGPGELSPPVHTVLAAALREGVTNVLRHAMATRCDITVRTNSGQVTLEIVHDGAADDVTEWKGAQKLRERLAEMDGDLTVERGAEGRLTVRATMPVAVADRAGAGKAETGRNRTDVRASRRPRRCGWRRRGCGR